MDFSVLSGLSPEIIGIILIFIVFIFMVKKMLKVIINIIWISVAAALFPFIMNNFLGFSIPITIDSILFFVMIGIGVYLLYIIGKIIYVVLGVFEKTGKVVVSPFSKSEKEKQKRMKKDIEELMRKKKEKAKKDDDKAEGKN